MMVVVLVVMEWMALGGDGDSGVSECEWGR